MTHRAAPLTLLWLVSCGGSAPALAPARPAPAPAPTCLSAGATWAGDNAATILNYLKSREPRSRPVAVFDWDNTMIKNDVGAAMVHHVIRQGLARRPASWDEVPYLTANARRRLAVACAGQGRYLPSANRPACARELASLYERRTLADGAPAFSGYNRRTYKPSAAWQVHLLAGHTPARVRAMARQVIRRGCAAAVGQTTTVGGLRVPAYLRLYRPMAAVVRRMQRSGFDVWVVSASPQHVVEVFAAQVGVPASRVIGIRSVLDRQGRITRDLRGCGAVKDGDNSLITYVEGKRCWIRKVIGRPVSFAAGDSVTDVSFLRDATDLRLVIDRGYPELMCHALNGTGAGRWIINPMFIAPRARRVAPFACSTTACVDPAGAPRPCRDGDRVLPDRPDAPVHR